MINWNFKVRWTNVQLISLCQCCMSSSTGLTHISVMADINGWHQCPTGEVRDKRSERHEGDQLLETFLYRRGTFGKHGSEIVCKTSDDTTHHRQTLLQQHTTKPTLATTTNTTGVVWVCAHALFTNVCLSNRRALVYPRLRSGHLPVGFSSAERRTEKLGV